MRELDFVGMELCKYQADLFEASAGYLECSSPIFIRRFVHSDIARRMDDTGFLLESLDVPGCLEQLKKEKNLEYGTKKYPTYVLSWIGYMYRYIAYTREVSTQRVYSCIKQEQMFETYEAYHGLDPEEATRRLFEANHLNPDAPVDYLAIVRQRNVVK